METDNRRTIFRTLLGGIIGGALGILATLILTQLAIFLSPGDPSAGSVGIIIIGFLPGGIITGLLFGLATSRRKPKP